MKVLASSHMVQSPWPSGLCATTTKEDEGDRNEGTEDILMSGGRHGKQASGGKVWLDIHLD